MDKLLGGLRILLVEDVALLAINASEMLIDLGAADVLITCSLSEGLAAAGASSFDAAVLDINLDGERSDPIAEVLSVRGVPFIFASGYGRNAGAPGPIVDKPYREHTIAAAIIDAIEVRRRQTEWRSIGEFRGSSRWDAALAASGS